MTDNKENGRLPGDWLAFSPDTPEEQAVARFTEKHGHPPREVHRVKGLLLVGPVTKEGAGPLNQPHGSIAHCLSTYVRSFRFEAPKRRRDRRKPGALRFDISPNRSAAPAMKATRKPVLL